LVVLRLNLVTQAAKPCINFRTKIEGSGLAPRQPGQPFKKNIRKNADNWYTLVHKSSKLVPGRFCSVK
jgi:hypothetical protein